MSPRATCFRCDIRDTGQGHGCHALHHMAKPVKERRAVPTPSGHGPRSESPRAHAGLGSLVCRAQANWRIGSDPSLSLSAERRPLALTGHLTLAHGVRDITYGDMRGKGSGPHAWKATRLPNGFGFTDSAQPSPPVSGRALLRARRKDASALRGGAGRFAPTPSSSDPPPGQRAQTRKRVRWLRQAIHFVLAPAASQDG